MRIAILAPTVAVLAVMAFAGPGHVQPATAPRPPGGETLFKARCGICHEGSGPGVMTLSKRLGKDRSLIAERADLEPAYVKFVVRRGLRAMPPLGRIEITNAELDQIAGYVTRHHGGAP
jgi:mono/diheme cytochrome c family protein